jgi:DnaD/phage-associated family protein
MSWAKFDDQYPDHPKIVKVGPLGMALHLAATCYCARYLTDGFVASGMIPRLISLDGIFIIDNAGSNGVSNAVTHKQLTDSLVDAGLFDAVQDGFMVHDYLKYNPPAEQVKAERARNAKRQARMKDRQKNNAGSNAGSNGVSTDAPYPYPIKEEEEEPHQPKNIYTVYSNNIGNITQIIADALDQAEKDYTADWIVSAIDEAVKNNVRSWSYINAVLQRWKRDGFKSDSREKKSKNGNGHKPSSKPVYAEEY